MILKSTKFPSMKKMLAKWVTKSSKRDYLVQEKLKMIPTSFKRPWRIFKMKITKKDLKQIIKEELISVLREGRREKDWIKQQPKEEQEQWLSAEQQGLKLSDLAWIKKVRGGEPIQDIIGDVVQFKNQKTQQILKSNNFETNLSKKTYPTVNDLRRTLQKISDANESDIQYDNVLKDPSQVEFLGKVGNWEILMPTTQVGSVACDISGKDTTWCTQRRGGQNLFYSYVGRIDGDIILFYVMDYSRTPNLKGKDADARLSIGFVNGKPVLGGQSGGLSVNAENVGLTEDMLQGYLGRDYSKIMDTLQRKAEQGGWSHREKEMLRKAAQNVVLLKKLTKDYKKQEREDFYREILKQDEISPKVHAFIAKDENAEVRREVAYDRNTPPEVLAFLAKDEDSGVRYSVAINQNTPPEVFVALAKDEIKRQQNSIGYSPIVLPFLSNPNTPTEVLVLLLKNLEAHIKRSVARDHEFLPEVLAILAKDEDAEVRYNVATNKSTPPEDLVILAKDEDKDVRFAVSRNYYAPPEALAILAKNEDAKVRYNVARNKNTPPEAFVILAKDETSGVRYSVMKNKNTPPEALAILAKDEDERIRNKAKSRLENRNK